MLISMRFSRKIMTSQQAKEKQWDEGRGGEPRVHKVLSVHSFPYFSLGLRVDAI